MTPEVPSGSAGILLPLKLSSSFGLRAGDWGSLCWYIRYIEKSVKLLQFDISEEKFRYSVNINCQLIELVWSLFEHSSENIFQASWEQWAKFVENWARNSFLLTDVVFYLMLKSMWGWRRREINLKKNLERKCSTHRKLIPTFITLSVLKACFNCNSNFLRDSRPGYYPLFSICTNKVFYSPYQLDVINQGMRTSAVLILYIGNQFRNHRRTLH